MYSPPPTPLCPCLVTLVLYALRPSTTGSVATGESKESTDLFDDSFPTEFLISPQQHETRKDISRHHVQVTEELREQLGDLSKRVLHTDEQIISFITS